MTLPRIRSAFSLISGAMFFTPLAHAEQPSSETYIVTARHWQEPTLMIPASIDTVNVEDRKASPETLEQQVSNVRVEHSSVQTQVAIRGSTGYNTSLQQPVGYYLDDIALPLGGTQLPPLFNFESITVIKGPQGDLYGRHSQAGVIKLTSQSPDWQPRATAQLSSGITQGAKDDQPSHVLAVRGSNTLMDDVLAGSIAIRAEHTSGPQYNLFDDNKQSGKQENVAANISFDGIIGSNTQWQWRSHSSRLEMGKAQMRYLTGLAATPRFTTNYNSNSVEHRDTDIHSLRIDHDWQGLTLTSISGGTVFRRDFTTDLDLTPAPMPPTVMTLKDNMLSQELRLTNAPSSETFRWLVGAYLFQQDSDIDFTIGGSQMMPRTQRITAIAQSGIAAFGQVEWQLQPDWALTLGLRAERINKQGHQRFYSIAANQYQADLDHTIWLPKTSLRYQFSPTSQVYLSAAQGYLPAGFNYASAQNLASFTYDEETSTNIELGYKALLLKDRLQFSGAIFHITTQDKQITDLQPGFVQTISNAAKTTSYGAELSADYRWYNAISSFARLGAMTAEADQYIVHTFNGSGFVSQDLAGNDLPLAPALTYAVGIEYRPQQGWFARLVGSGSSKYYFDSANTLSHPSYFTLDAELGYQFSHASLALNIDNAFDELRYSRSVSTPQGVVVEDSHERYFGLTVKMDW
ncbi:TonB-dependent receptor [Thaumasiovibrio subtropicus]|uniref:TonB-dependent receptor n=1 Tax=Thaumasiovibrio subtropicus TaxID=1891207 RepID=UPI000B35D478|nr:TonB-dependent receptor [Thaumasiovibrio subtropicus]